MQGSKKDQMKHKNRIRVFGINLGYASAETWHIIHVAQVAYLNFRLAEQDYENGILTVRL